MTPANVLVVDDDLIMRCMLESMLDNYGYSITTASDGEKAIQLLENITYDLVITDLEMGETSGLEVIKKAKEVSPNTLVFMMTGCHQVEFAIAAFHCGVEEYLLKPFSNQCLMECLKIHGFPIFSKEEAMAVEPGGQQSLLAVIQALSVPDGPGRGCADMEM